MVDFPFDDIQSNDEWITKERDDIEQVRGAYDGENVHLDGVTRDPTLNPFILII